MTEEREVYSAGDGISKLEASFLFHWRVLVPDELTPVREFRFCERRYRLDFAWPAQAVAVECEGGIWQQGRHTRGKGFEDDCKKYNRATADGWRIFRCTAGMLKDNPAAFVEIVRKAIKEARWNSSRTW